MIFKGKVTGDDVIFDKTHPGTEIKKCSKHLLKSLEHPQKFLDVFIYGWVFLKNPGTPVTPKKLE